MKTNHYLTLSAVIVAGFISCTSENLVSETSPTGKTNEPTAMSFDVHTQNQTRASALQNSYKDFGVWAYKNMPSGTTDGEYQQVMPNYLVGYYDETNKKGYYANSATTIGDKESTTDGKSMWFYEGLGKDEYSHSNETGEGATTYETSSLSVNNKQELKYWDYNSTSTDFFAYAPYGNGDLYSFNAENKEISTTDWVWAGFSNQEYQEKLLAYKNVEKVSYGKDVQLTFKRINAAVQLAFYAPIPGFWVTVNSVVVESAHQDANGAIVTGEDDKVAYGTKVKMGTTGEIVVIESDLYHITTSNDQPSTTAPNTFGVPVGSTVQNKFHGEEVTGESYKNLANIIGTTSEASALSYSPNTFYAMPANSSTENSGFKVHVEFTIYSQNTDETQNLQGDVFISPNYTQWKSNYKYVYIFKLTHQTPIVFDGITISDYTEETSIPESIIVGEKNNND